MAGRKGWVQAHVSQRTSRALGTWQGKGGCLGGVLGAKMLNIIAACRRGLWLPWGLRFHGDCEEDPQDLKGGYPLLTVR